MDQVEELQACLSIKKNELEQKNALPNQKLKEMVKDQQEAEKRKVTSQEIQEQLRVQTQSIKSKREVVLHAILPRWSQLSKKLRMVSSFVFSVAIHVHEVTTGLWLFCACVKQMASHTNLCFG